MAAYTATQRTPTISVDTHSLQRFARVLRKEAPELSRRMRSRLRDAGELVADDARARAREASTTIPPTIRVRTSGTYVTVRAGRGVPLAGLFEEGNRGKRGGGGFFRHPVFGNTNNWVSQPMHPFLRPAMEHVGPAAVEMIALAVDETLRLIAVEET